MPHNKIDGKTVTALVSIDDGGAPEILTRATVDDLFSHGCLQTFAILNLYFFGSVVALIEVFFLNSIRRPGVSQSPMAVPPPRLPPLPALLTTSQYCEHGTGNLLTGTFHQPSYSHILGLTVFAVLYFLWAYLGRYLTGKWCYYFLNYKKEGWENVFVALLAFISLLNIFYAFVYGLIGVREAAVDKEDRGTGYEIMYE